jgi:uncharacterized YigZ family protein
MPDIIKPVKTVRNYKESTIKEKGSVFLGQVFPVDSEEVIENILKTVRKKHYDASHNCFAWRLKNEQFKYSDDGEPGGTAGVRIFNALDHYGLTDVLCIVTRWFGGTKLGVGPLGKAYYASAEEVLKKAEHITKNPYFPYIIKAPFELSSRLYYMFEKHSVIIEKTEYFDLPVYHLLIPADEEITILTALQENPAKRLDVHKVGLVKFL